MTNLFADDAMIYASGDSVSEVQLNLQSCLINISQWYRENRLKINSDKSKVMLVGSKAQLKSLNVDIYIKLRRHVIRIGRKCQIFRRVY